MPINFLYLFSQIQRDTYGQSPVTLIYGNCVTVSLQDLNTGGQIYFKSGLLEQLSTSCNL